jgi:hypothetical protein
MKWRLSSARCIQAAFEANNSTTTKQNRMKKGKRPVIKLQLSISDKAIEIVGWIALLAMWIVLISNYTKMSATIPVHYNAIGQADRYGSKENILILPILGTVIFIGLTMLNRFPDIFNYPVEITIDNAQRQYLNATRMMRYLKLMIIVFFELILFIITNHSPGHTGLFGVWFIPMILGLFFMLLLIFVIKSYRAK